MPFIQLHANADQIPTYADTASFPTAGQIGRIAYSLADAQTYFDNGSSWVSIALGGTDVTATANFGTDNRLVRSDGVAKGTQASLVTLSDTGSLSGIENIALSGTVDGRDVSTDGGVLDTAILDADFGFNGLMARTASGTYASRTVTGTANQVVVSNGDGQAGNPTLTLPQSIHTAGTPTFASLTLSANQFITSIVTTTASDAGSHTIAATTTFQILVPDAAAVAAFTVNMPGSPANGQIVYLTNGHATNTIVALTMGGGTIVGPLTALGSVGSANSKAGYVYQTSNTTWYRFT